MSAKPLVSKHWGFPNPDQFTRDVLFLLEKGWEIRTVGELTSSHLVQHQPGTFGPVWFLNDNGGEINLGVVNSDQLSHSVPVTAFRRALDAGTVAYRIAMTMKGEKVDYDFEMPELLQDLRELNTVH